jgi:DNA ligase (NAD+)
MKTNRIQELEKLILYHKELYYRGQAEISDESYDLLEDELKALDPGNPVLEIVGHLLVEPAEKVPHAKKMLSLEKTYSEDELLKWIGENDVISVLKIDGSSCSLIYRNGHLQVAKTRGDGSFGENITKKAIFVPSIPKTISETGEIEIRGEIFCMEQGFIKLSQQMEKLGLEKPSSQRNIVAGILGRKENIQLASYLSFKAFDLITSKKYSKEHEKLQDLERLGFLLPDFKLNKNQKDVQARILEAKEFIATGEYLVDGLVFVFDDLKLHSELGETSHHPRYKKAFKFSGETKITSITKIEWGVSRNGVLTPVAHVTPVELSGALISRVTLHNFGIAQNFELKAGDKIEIVRSGEVIPKFLGVAEKSTGDFIYPHFCPSCHSKLSIQDIWLVCQNEKCPAKMKEEILHYVHKSGIDDISDKRLEEMIAKGVVKNIPDLYKLKKEDFLVLDKVKDKLATKMFENIQKSKNQTLSQFISAIGTEGVSVAKCEKIIAQGYNSIEKIQNLSVDKMQEIEGFAEKSSLTFIDSIRSKNGLISDLISLGVSPRADDFFSSEGPLLGIKFCITGELSMPRGEFEKLIKSKGGVMVSSVSKNTNYLVTNEKESSSSKFIKAKSLNIPIISEAQLLNMIQE